MKRTLSHSEENYLKMIFHLSEGTDIRVSTNALAERLQTKASSITDMLKKLEKKELISYKPYKGCELTGEGERIAIQIIRKHRLWETFLVNKLEFGWEEVHDVAEQLEHIRSVKLIDSLDHFLGQPKFDPHGDPIPDKEGNIPYRESEIRLSEAAAKSLVEVVSVNEDSLSLLKYLDEIKLRLGTLLEVHERYPFDESIRLKLKGKKSGIDMNLSKKVAESIGVRFISKLEA